MLNTEKGDCTGCAACVNICPANAISMNDDEEGFAYPSVCSKKCTKCDLCNKACPAQGGSFRVGKRPRVYAAWAMEKEIVAKSSSGGIFSILAETILEKGGVVCGAGFENSKLVHQIVERKEDLNLLLGSKYVQSEMGQIPKKILLLVKSGKTVLFTGTPCQVAGMHKLLGGEYRNLITVDLLCHSVPSKKVFERYIKEESMGDSFSSIEFRNKKYGWKNYSIRLINKIGEIIEPHKRNIYMRGFLKDLFSRPCCSKCFYNKLPRVADISLGDFWRVEKINRKLENPNGTSLVLLNSFKGKKMFKSIRNRIFYKKICISQALKSNPIIKKCMTAHPLRSLFFSQFLNTNRKFRQIVTDCLSGTISSVDKKVAIMNFHYSTFNYGALMVPYSMSKILDSLGYEPYIVNYLPIRSKKRQQNGTVFGDFLNKYLSLTNKCEDISDLEKLNSQYTNFITGSDQVWRWHDDYNYFLKWVSGKKRIISYAASFGIEALESRNINIARLRFLLSRFDSISVRERSAVSICAEAGAHAIKVLDPTMLLKATDYDNIIHDYKPYLPESDYVGFMILNKDLHKRIYQTEIIKKIQCEIPVIDIMFNEKGENRNFGEWLGLISKSRTIITDSFHGSVFSIIYRKNFICIANEMGGVARIEDLFLELELPRNHFVNTIEDIKHKQIYETIDYSEIEKALLIKVNESKMFIQEALNMSIVKKISEYDYFNEYFRQKKKKSSGIFNFAKKVVKKIINIFFNRGGNK